MRVLILGAGVSGAAAARLARRCGYRVTVYDRSDVPTRRLAAEGFATVSGDWRADLLEGVEVVVTSPGFAETSPPITDALEAGVEVWSEIEFAARHLERPIVAVTGTNGKTTVTELISSMLKAGGVDAPALGNIGAPLSDAVGEEMDVAVVETSSFQLRFIDRFHPRIAVVTNVAVDHLDWHRSEGSYRSAKARIFENQGPDDDLVFDGDDAGTRDLVSVARSRRWAVGSGEGEGDWGIRGDVLRIPGGEVELDRLAIDDPILLTDVALAAVVAGLHGLGTEAVATVASSFRPSPHRRTVVGTWRGIRFVDDSKATNPHAAVAAIAAFAPVVLIAGGQAKGLDLRPLVEHPGVRRVVAIGEAAPVLEAFDPEKVIRVDGLTEAVQEATAVARVGDTVLLAPGCASFDMFASYAERGDAFTDAVSTIMEVAR